MHRMEVRIYGSDRRFCTSPDEGLPPTHAFMDLKETCIYQQPILIPSLEITENQGQMQPGFHGSPKTTSANKPMGYSMGDEISGGRTLTSTSFLFGQKELFREEEWKSKVSSPVIDTGSQDSSFTVLDVKLGRLAKIMDVKNDKCPIDAGSSSSVPSTPLAKKIWSTGLNSQIPYCQVYGCSMDLSSSKNYHKKHKVCDIHSKTSKVVVSGREQCFCQQCSRFHLLAEFDDGKRSCRRCLTGHNERRRKPQLDTYPGRSGKLFQSYYGEGFLDASLLVRTSFLPTEHANGILHELGHENADWCQHVKVDDEYPSNGQATVNGQLLTEAFLSNYSTVKQFSSIHNTGSPSWNISYEHGDEVHLGYASNGSNIEAFPRVRESIRALSLLSFQSQNGSGYSSAIPVVHPVILPDRRAQNSITQLSDKAPLVASQASTTVASQVLFRNELKGI